MRRAVHLAIGVSISALLMWLLFRDVHWDLALAPLGRIRWGWFILAQLPLWWVMLIRVFRWHAICRAIQPEIGVRPVFSATQIGWMANMILPARLGELVRPLTLSQLEPRISFSQGLALQAVDRLTDLVGLVASLLIAVLTFDTARPRTLPAETFGTAAPITFSAEHLHRGAMIGGGMFGALLLLIVLLLVNDQLALRITAAVCGLFSRRLATWAVEVVARFTEGLAAVRDPSRMAKAVALSLLLWGSFVIDNAWFFEAFGIEWDWSMAFVMQAILMVSIAVPGAPGFIGPFHVAIVISLVMLEVAPDEAKGMAILFHVMNVIPVLVLGMLALWIEDLRLLELVEDDQLSGQASAPK